MNGRPRPYRLEWFNTHDTTRPQTWRLAAAFGSPAAALDRMDELARNDPRGYSYRVVRVDSTVLGEAGPDVDSRPHRTPGEVQLPFGVHA